MPKSSFTTEQEQSLTIHWFLSYKYVPYRPRRRHHSRMKEQIRWSATIFIRRISPLVSGSSVCRYTVVGRVTYLSARSFSRSRARRCFSWRWRRSLSRRASSAARRRLSSSRAALDRSRARATSRSFCTNDTTLLNAYL